MTRLCIFTAAKQFGDAPALRFKSHTYSFSTLADACRLSCDQLTKLPSTRIVEISATNHPDTIISLLAALHCQRTVAMLPPFTSSKSPVCLERNTETLFSPSIPNTPKAKELKSTPTKEARCILFTSGSSASPKGVVLPESALIASAKASEANLGWHPSDQWILNLPLSHIGGLSILFRCLLAGKCVHLHERFVAVQVFESIATQGATMLSLVPTTLHRLMASEQASILKQLRVILLGGAAASDVLRHKWRTLKLPVLETYGMTETASQVATTPLTTALQRSHTGMKPLDGVIVTIINEDGSPLPANTAGRIQVAGPMIMSGYLGVSPCHGKFITEDSGYIDDNGFVHVLGRMDSLIITGGENVHPTQVEEKLKRIEGVSDAVVFGVKDEEYGQIVAAALFVQIHLFRKETLADILKKELATHHRPRRVYIASAEKLPLLENGKINRRLVMETASQNLINVIYTAYSAH
ncbi:MAG: long-chain fatty acid--CoA ligase [Deltaproteobacteria bacterium]|nr:long-chain fatty acid--CoA ligase [Deltaproteobacteria bacterium]